jgi:hypothetical protein
VADPYAVLGLDGDADEAAVHGAYRRAVRRTHPDAGGSAAEFEAVQEAYEAIRRGGTRPRTPTPPRPPPRRPPAAEPQRMDDLLAESHRLENEARRLAGLPPRDFGGEPVEGETGDSLAAILADAQRQLREVATATAREVSRRVRRLL